MVYQGEINGCMNADKARQIITNTNVQTITTEYIIYEQTSKMYNCLLSLFPLTVYSKAHTFKS